MLCKSDVIWNDPLDSNNGSPYNWTITGQVIPYITSPDLYCANTLYCWEFSGTSDAYFTHPTFNYFDIKLTYRVSGNRLDGSDECNVYYSIDSNTNWIQLGSPWKTNTKSQLITIQLPSNTFNHSNIGIRLASVNVNANSHDECYFSDITLNGSTNAPTTTAPATTAPATTTVTATAFIETTSVSTATSMITSSPSTTSSSSTSSSTSTTTSTMDTTLSEEFKETGTSYSAVYGGIAVGSGLFLLICVMKIVTMKRKRVIKTTEETIQNMNQTVYGNDGGEKNQVSVVTNNPMMNVNKDEINLTPVKLETISIDKTNNNNNVNSNTNVNVNGKENENESSDDSVMRKQLQYAYEEECNIDNAGNAGGDGTPLPGFDNTLIMQTKSQELLFNDIMKDMNNSQLRLQQENELENTVQNDVKENEQ